MKLSAVLLARVIYFVESVDLNPRGAAYYPDVIAALVKRYGFLVYPQKPEEFDEKKGVTLRSGRAGDRTIESVIIYNWGITLDTTSSTSDSEELLEEALVWGVENLRLRYSPDMIKRKGYVSHVTFYSETRLLSLNPVFDVIGAKLGKIVSANVKLPYAFEPRGINFSIDPETQRIPVQHFIVERRDGVAYSENKYFSAAPVPTDRHFELIEDLEKASGPKPSGA